MSPGVRAWFTPRRLLAVVALVAAWCAIWQRVSLANVASGLIVAVVALSFSPPPAGSGTIRPAPLLRFFWLVGVDLVRSTITVAREILTPTDHTEEAIIRVDTPVDTRSHLLLLVVAITVTPGTAVVDTDPDSGRLYLHVLHAEQIPEIVAHVERIADLACRALPIEAAADAAREPVAGPPGDGGR